MAAWPGTTEAFEQAKLCAQVSGNISKRTVDIGSGEISQSVSSSVRSEARHSHMFVAPTP